VSWNRFDSANNRHSDDSRGSRLFHSRLLQHFPLLAQAVASNIEGEVVGGVGVSGGSGNRTNHNPHHE
jgi:hypothetical protein